MDPPKRAQVPEERVAGLVRAIQRAEKELQELTGGQLDAVADGDGRPMLLREAQEKLRESEAAQRALAETQSGILNALPAHIALVDARGVIVAVNEAWRRFAAANVPNSSDFFVGENYLSVCERAYGECSSEAQPVAEGIRKVLKGELEGFSMEYPCHSPEELRWFRLMVTPLNETSGAGVVVMHINITERRLAEEVLKEQEKEQRRLAEKLRTETQRLHESQAVASVGSWETDLATLEVSWTDETFRIFETSREGFEPTHQRFLERVHPEDRERVTEAFKQSIGQPGHRSIEHRILLPDGGVKHVEEHWRTFTDAEGRPVRAVGTCQDITERKMAETVIRSRARQQETLAKIGFEATRATALNEIFEYATEAVAEALDVELCKVLRLESDGRHLRLVSGVGWQPGLAGSARVPVSRESQAGFTLESEGPVRVSDFAKETRFVAPSLLQQHQVVSGLSVKIFLRDQPWGVLGAHSRAARQFNDGDADFLQTVAALLAVVIERLAFQESLTESEARMRNAQRIAHLGNWRLDLENNGLSWSEEVFRIFGVEPGKFPGTYQSFFQFVHPDDREAMQAAQASALAGEGPLEIEHRIVRGDGGIRYVQERGELVRDENGAPVAISGTVLDITERRTAVEQLRQREQLLRIAGHVARMGGWSVDIPDFRVTWSEEVCAIHGVPAGTAPTLEEALSFYSAETRPVVESALGLCAREGTPFDVELEVITAQGRSILVRSIAQAERDDTGAIRRVQGAIQDITEQKKVEAEALRAAETLADIVQVQQEVANANLTLGEVIQLMAERARSLTGATGGAVELIEGGELVYAAGAGVAADKVGLRLKREGSLSGLAISSRAVLYCEDTETDPRADRATCRKIGVRSMIVAPLAVGEECLGVLKVLSGRPKAFGKRDVHNLQLLVETLGAVIQRQRAAEALRASVEEFRNLAEAMPQIVWVTRADGWNIYFNQHWMDYTGLTLEESLGHGWNKPFHPEDQNRAWAAWQDATARVGLYSLECRLRRADGEYRWWLIRGEPQKDAEGRVLKWFGTCTDIHSLKLAELEITRSNRALKMLSACNEALIHAVDENELLRTICQIAVASGGYRMAWVGYAEEDPKRTIQPMAHAGEEQGYLSEIILSWQEGAEPGDGPAGRTIRSGQVSISMDVEQEAGFRWRQAARQRGYRSVICLPLRGEARTFGLLALYSGSALQVGEEEIRLLQELADDLAFGIGHLRAQRESERIQSVVTKVATAVSASTGSEFFEQLVANMAGALGASGGFVAELLPGEPPCARILAGVVDERKIKDLQYEIDGTPCMELLTNDEFICTDEVMERFPKLSHLAGGQGKACVGRSLTNAAGQKIGMLYVLFREALKETGIVAATLRIFAARAASEMERQRADQQVREQAALLDAAHDAIIVKDLKGRVVYWNKGAERLYGWTAREVIGQEVRSLLYGDLTKFDSAERLLFKNGSWEGELPKLARNGRTIPVQVSWTLVRDASGEPSSVLAINSDLTEKKKLEAQFLRAQRMESIGTLAGGIAHDLNNVLAPIMMAVELLQGSVQDEQDKKLLATLLSSAQRGADLVRQVLSFARGVEGQRIPVNAGHLVRELVRVMRETFPKNINIDLKGSAPVWAIPGDPTQIHQVILNLCVNARDAMQQGGKLTLAVENKVLDETYAAMNPDARAGSYVVIKVDDSGTGIPPELRDRIFDPFFTTKEVGKGTGLGLSTTLAIVKSHGGFIRLSSELGKGTKFEVYFPADASKESSDLGAAEETELPRGNGQLILVVDDEETIRNVARSTLERFGYTVVTAEHGASAVAVYAERKNSIAAVLTDMAMPIMDGPALVLALRSINPKVRIIGSSGLASAGAGPKPAGLGLAHFIPKPYTAEVMLRAMRAVLDQP